MLTISLAITQAFATNKYFEPSILYLGTFIVDIELIQVLLPQGLL